MQRAQNKKPGAKHVILIILMVALSVAIYLFKDDFLPNANAAYQAEYAKFERAEAVIVDRDIHRGRKGSNTTWIVEFKDKEGNTHTGRILQTNTLGKENGEIIIIYYNPADPSGSAVSEETYKEVMR
ncbi:DUF3592 domain-containing protein [Dysgonomonas sp. 25]|uniref:DUF3592 domain-containing protein n=1 Tax=Dysgonomonas sp. 25 TaxID=2302933 RepID=UPI0013D31B88|nr:DUF3592 domain-containing protein [Dysgonomonas sp. 25]